MLEKTVLGVLQPLAVEPAFGIKRGLATRSCAGDGLTVGMVFDVTCRPYAFDIGRADVVARTAFGFQVAGFVHIELAFENIGVGFMADGDENAFDDDVFGSAVIVFQTSTGDAAFVAQDFVQIAVELEDDFAFFNALHEFVHHDFFGAEAVAAMNQGDGVGDVGEVKGFFYGSIAAADDGHVLLFIEETVAGRASGYAFTGKGLFAGQPQIFGGCAGGDDQGVAGVLTHVAFKGEGTVLQIDGVDLVENHFGAEAFGVSKEARHQFRTLYAFSVSGPVVDFGGGHQLSALFDTGNDDGLEVGAGGIDGGGVASRT